MALGYSDALYRCLELKTSGDDLILIVPDLDLVAVSFDEFPPSVLGADLVLGEFWLLPSADQSDVAGCSKHLCAADAAANLYMFVSMLYMKR